MLNKNKLYMLNILVSTEYPSKFKFSDYRLNINLDLAGLLITINTQFSNLSLIEIIDNTVGNYHNLYNTSPSVRFSKTTKEFQYFHYSENMETICLLDRNFPVNRKQNTCLYFEEHLSEYPAINNWNYAYLFEDRIAFIGIRMHLINLELLEFDEIKIIEHFSFLIYENLIIGFIIDFKGYYAEAWSVNEKNWLIEYLQTVCRSNWLAESDDANICKLNKILSSYNGNIFSSDIENIIFEISD